MLSCVVDEDEEVGEATALKAGVIVFQASKEGGAVPATSFRDPESCTCLPSASDQPLCDWRLRVQTLSPISSAHDFLTNLTAAILSTLQSCLQFKYHTAPHSTTLNVGTIERISPCYRQTQIMTSKMKEANINE